MTAQQIRFVKDSLPAAVSAGAAFRINPTVVLAQAAFESGWGTSRLATEGLNFFGLTAYGCSNAYWHGQKMSLQGRNGPHFFRRYASRELAFFDFARLICNNYRPAWQVSESPEAYAKEIAYSAYINELNGDDRETYRRSLVSISNTIQAIVQLLTDNVYAFSSTDS